MDPTEPATPCACGGKTRQPSRTARAAMSPLSRPIGRQDQQGRGFAFDGGLDFDIRPADNMVSHVDARIQHGTAWRAEVLQGAAMRFLRRR